MTTKQKLAIFVILLLTGFAMFLVWTGDNLELARRQLLNFYSAKFDSCEIVDLDERGYNGMRGTYSLFRTDCSEEFFAIRPETYDVGQIRRLFSIGNIVSKDHESYDIQLADGDGLTTIKFRTAESEDRRPLGFKIVLSISALLLLLTIFLPRVIVRPG